MVVCLLPKLFDGEMRGKAKSRVSAGEPGTNTIKGLERLRGRAGGNFPVCTAGEEVVFSSRGNARGTLRRKAGGQAGACGPAALQ